MSTAIPTKIGASLAGVLVALSLSACGSSEDSSEADDFTDQSATKIAKQAEKAMKGLSSVRLAGDVTTDGDKMHLDVKLSRSGDCTGTMGVGNATAQILVVGGSQYLKGDEAFWKMSAGSEAGAQQIIDMVKGKWAIVPSGETDFSEFCDLDSFLEQMDDDADEVGKKGKIADVNGTKAIALTGKDGKEATTGWVAVDGKHYILKMEVTGGDEPGTITFSEFDQPVQVTKPPANQVFDFNKLG